MTPRVGGVGVQMPKLRGEVDVGSAFQRLDANSDGCRLAMGGGVIQMPLGIFR
jgi:hypothetical protein